MNDIQRQLSRNWIFGYENFRVTDDNVYAFDFPSKSDESVNMFITRFNQTVSRLGSVYSVIGAHLEFTEPMFTVVEFTEYE